MLFEGGRMGAFQIVACQNPPLSKCFYSKLPLPLHRRGCEACLFKIKKNHALPQFGLHTFFASRIWNLSLSNRWLLLIRIKDLKEKKALPYCQDVLHFHNLLLKGAM